MDLATYLSFDGQCEQAFRFYAEVLGGQILMLARYSEAPAGEPVHEGMANRIMHARLKVGDRLLMGGDAPPGRVHRPQGFCVLIAADSAGEAERMFNALADGGTITMPFGETFWAHRFGMAIDRFGTPWMVNFEKAMAAQVAGSKPFVISRTFAAPRHEVWKAFTDPDRLRQWWGPKGATVTASKMDLRPGGTYHYRMQTADGSEIWGRMVYREIVPEERIVLISSFSDASGGLARHPMAPTWPIETHSTFTFTEQAGKTTFTVTWLPLNPTPEEQATFDAGHDSMTNGWSGTLDRLVAHLARS